MKRSIGPGQYNEASACEGDGVVLLLQKIEKILIQRKRVQKKGKQQNKSCFMSSNGVCIIMSNWWQEVIFIGVWAKGEKDVKGSQITTFLLK